MMNLAPDHLVICATDLDEATDDIEERHGLTSVYGGRHPGHGTANRIIPLGDSYIEVVAVVDKPESANSAFGSWVAAQARGPLSINALCLRTDDIASLAVERGLEPVAMSRAKPDGSALAWHIAGIDRTIADGYPFFIQWSVPDHELPGSVVVEHRAGPAHLDSVQLHGEKELLEAWVSVAHSVTVSEGPPTISAWIVTSTGDIRI